MKILAAADLHGERGIYEWLLRVVARKAPQALVLAGDLLGHRDASRTVQEAQRKDAGWIADAFGRLEAPVFYVLGNCDWIDVGPNEGSLLLLHGCRIEYGSYNFVGYPYTPPFMGGILERDEGAMAEDLRGIEAKVDDRTVLVTHGPARGILDLPRAGVHAGSTALLDLVRRRPPRIHIHGHIHESFGRKGRHFNVASAGRRRAILIDLETMEHEVVRG